VRIREWREAVGREGMERPGRRFSGGKEGGRRFFLGSMSLERSQDLIEKVSHLDQNVELKRERIASAREAATITLGLGEAN